MNVPVALFAEGGVDGLPVLCRGWARACDAVDAVCVRSEG